MEKEITERMLESGTDMSVLPEKRVYTVSDVVGILQVSKPTVLKLLKEGKFSAFQIGANRAWRISKKSFDAWLDSQTGEKNT